MERRFDLVVIGTGVASAVASRVREAGWTVGVIDYRPFGGTCVLRGCVPKKILVSAAEAIHAVRAMAGRGVPAPPISIDWPELIATKRRVTDPVPARTEEAWGRAGVELFHGRARFVGPSAVEVGADWLIGRHVLIAAGAMPAPLPFPGREHVTMSDQFMELAWLPPRVVFVGGGYVSFEFAHVAARAGARVTILHRGSRPLEAFDPDTVALAVRRTREIGIAVELSTEVRAVEPSASGLRALAVQNGGAERRFETDLVVHGAGRIPEVDDLDLHVADVKRDRRGVVVNQYLQSVSNPAVYVAGDAAASGPPLTPVAQSPRRGGHHQSAGGQSPDPELRGPRLGRLHRAAAGFGRAHRGGERDRFPRRGRERVPSALRPCSAARRCSGIDPPGIRVRPALCSAHVERSDTP
jgi:glutathione reductase (NADPH)